MKLVKQILGLAIVVILIGSCTVVNKATFPSADEVFLTSGDGDITKPYTPIGQLIYTKSGLGFLFFPIVKVDVDLELKTKVVEQIKSMGGDAMINMDLSYSPGKKILGLYIQPPTLIVNGTVINR